MNILICYATTEGQTRKIMRFCADEMLAQGHGVELLPVSEADPIDFARYDAAILAGSVHIGAIQEELCDFASRHHARLNAMPTLFLVVSLAAAGKDGSDHAELDKIAEGFCTAAQWTPGSTHHVAGAFRFSKYDFFKTWAMRYIASQYGQKVDPHSDTEYTDWDDLSAVLKGWPYTA